MRLEIPCLTGTVETLLPREHLGISQATVHKRPVAHMAQPELDLPAGAPCRLRVECVSEFMPATGMIG